MALLPDLGSLLPTALPAAGRSSPTLRDLAGRNQSADQDDPEWYQGVAAEDAVRWDKSFPYQLLVLSRGSSGGWTRVRGWEYTFPIPPQGVTISTPFAASVSVSLDGVVEEISGAPIRDIRISGTTGVLPFRPSATQRGTSSIGESILGGTLRAAGNTLAAFRQMVSDVAGDGSPVTTLNVMSADEAAEQATLSGYYQLQLLRKFLEDYVKFRTTEKGRGCALAFCVWKEQAVYLCTPTAFDQPRSAQSPVAYPWSLTLRGWRRVRLDGVDSNRAQRSDADPSRRDPSVLARLLNTIQDARITLQGARSTLEAVGGDVDRTVFEPLREAALAVKDLLALPLALADLPGAVALDARDSILQLLAAKQDVADEASLVDARFAQAKADLRDLRDLLGGEVKDRSSAVSAAGALTGRQGVQVIAGAAVQGGLAPTAGLDVLTDPTRHYATYSLIPMSRVTLSRRSQEAVVEERRRVQRLGRKDWADRRTSVAQAGAAFAASVGAGSATYSATFGLAAPTFTAPLSRSNLRLTQALSAASTALSHLAAFGAEAAEASRLAGIEQIAQRAAASGMPFRVPRSKFAIPMPYGVTLERLAAAYLGDPGRWLEIAALNGLRSPYIDEVGWRQPLLVPVSGTVVVVGSADHLTPGQTVWLGGPTTSATKRHVLTVDVTPGAVALTLDGAPDLDRYGPATGCFLQGFLPGTVNSQMLVYLPSDQAPDGSFRVTGVPDAAQFGALTSTGGVDLLLDPANDLIVTPDGDARWAVGLTNIIQQFRLILGCTRGSLLGHPAFGLGIRAGEPTSDMSVADVAASVRAALAAYPAYRAVRQISLRKAGPVVQLSVDAVISNSNVTLPLSIDLLR